MRNRQGRYIAGTSGNPVGRPRIIMAVRDVAREYGDEAITVLASIMRDVNAPASARIAAVHELLNRAFGRPVDVKVMEIMGQADRPVSAKELSLAELDYLVSQIASEMLE